MKKKMEFQTPTWLCEQMAGMVPDGVNTILEPTPGEGNLVNALTGRGYQVVAPADYFKLDKAAYFDAVVMNPPFMPENLTGEIPAQVNAFKRGSHTGFWFVYEMMNRAPYVLTIIPWYFIINSHKRTRNIFNYGFKSVTNLARNTFQEKIKAQVCLLELQQGYTGPCEFRNV